MGIGIHIRGELPDEVRMMDGAYKRGVALQRMKMLQPLLPYLSEQQRVELLNSPAFQTTLQDAGVQGLGQFSEPEEGREEELRRRLLLEQLHNVENKNKVGDYKVEHLGEKPPMTLQQQADYTKKLLEISKLLNPQDKVISNTSGVWRYNPKHPEKMTPVYLYKTDSWGRRYMVAPGQKPIQLSAARSTVKNIGDTTAVVNSGEIKRVLGSKYSDERGTGTHLNVGGKQVTVPTSQRTELDQLSTQTGQLQGIINWGKAIGLTGQALEDKLHEWFPDMDVQRIHNILSADEARVLPTTIANQGVNAILNQARLIAPDPGSNEYTMPANPYTVTNAGRRAEERFRSIPRAEWGPRTGSRWGLQK